MKLIPSLFAGFPNTKPTSPSPQPRFGMALSANAKSGVSGEDWKKVDLDLLTPVYGSSANRFTDEERAAAVKDIQIAQLLRETAKEALAFPDDRDINVYEIFNSLLKVIERYQYLNAQFKVAPGEVEETIRRIPRMTQTSQIEKAFDEIAHKVSGVLSPDRRLAQSLYKLLEDIEQPIPDALALPLKKAAGW